MSRIRFLERVPLISHALNRTPQTEATPVLDHVRVDAHQDEAA
jgi:hypothetical protein